MLTALIIEDYLNACTHEGISLTDYRSFLLNMLDTLYGEHRITEFERETALRCLIKIDIIRGETEE